MFLHRRGFSHCPTCWKWLIWQWLWLFMLTRTCNVLDVTEGHELITTEPQSLIMNYLNESLNMSQHCLVVLTPTWKKKQKKTTTTIPKKDLLHAIISHASFTDLNSCILLKLEGHFCDLPDTKHKEEVDTSMEGENNKLAYCVTDVPPWYLCILLGIQVRQQTGFQAMFDHEFPFISCLRAYMQLFYIT